MTEQTTTENIRIGNGTAIHAMDPEFAAQGTSYPLCGAVRTVNVSAQAIRKTKAPVTCKGCTKRLG